MVESHDRNRLIFQALLALAVLSRIGLVLAQDEEAPLRFGDSDTVWAEPEPTTTPAAAPSATPISASPQKVAPTPSKNPRQIVRALIASVPPGDSYPEEFSRIVELGEAAIGPLEEVFSSPTESWQSRWIAGMALGRLGGERSRNALEKGLEDPLFLVRMAAITALGNLGEGSAASKIHKSLSDRAMVVRSQAAMTLGRLKDRSSIPFLVEELKAGRNFHRGRSLWVRGKILDALGEIGDPEAVPALIGVLKEQQGDLRGRTCEILSQLVPTAPPATEAPDEGCGKRWISWNANRTAVTPPSESSPPPPSLVDPPADK